MSPDARTCLKCPFLWPHLESEGFKNSEMTKQSFSNNGFKLAYVNEQRPEKSQAINFSRSLPENYHGRKPSEKKILGILRLQTIQAREVENQT